MRLCGILLLSSVASWTLGSIIPIHQDRDGLVPRATSTSSTKATSISSKSSSTRTSSVKTSSTSSSTSSSSLKTSLTSSTTTSSKSPSGSSTPSTSITPASSSVSSVSSTTSVADASCTNGPFTRACWGNGFSIATDFDENFPTTGVTRKYYLEITNTTMAPDGYSRQVMVINGQYPGPTIWANWGDMLEITVKNSLQENGTGLHFHGVRQFHTSTEDGVPGITECPLAPGDTKVYKFQATQFGTSWYHSHFSAQYGEGVFGTLIFNGPATSNYDTDLGTMTINDWYYRTTYQVADYIAHVGPPPNADNGLINGSMTSQYGGSYHTNTLTKGKKYRLRLINTSVDNHFMVSLDNHTFTVITSDFVPIKPYKTNWLFIGIGQRYDVIINANQTVGSYWFRAEVQDQAGCGGNSNNYNILSIFSYTGAPAGNPTSSGTSYTQRCTDETTLVPYWDSFVPTGPLEANTAELDTAINVGVTTSGAVVTWGINLTALNVDWDKPILQYVLEGNNSWPQTENLIELPNENSWYYWIIQEVAGIPITINAFHPIHLHGHDFYILGTGIGQYDQTTNGPTLEYKNPPRRDVAMLPAGGWLALAFQTDNPGAWIMHCHIAWHAGQGLAVQFLESKSTINNVDPLSALTQTCKNWNAWYPSQAYYFKDDSGI